MPLADAPIAHLRTPEEAAQWLRQRVRGQLRTDSRQVQAGDGFIAWPGAAADGRRFMAAALAQGAAANSRQVVLAILQGRDRDVD